MVGFLKVSLIENNGLLVLYRFMLACRVIKIQQKPAHQHTSTSNNHSTHYISKTRQDKRETRETKHYVMENELNQYVKEDQIKFAILQYLVYNEMSKFRFSYGHTT